MIPSQMLKGILEGCILAIIKEKETYGYEISQKLESYGFGTVTEGTIYPLLLRLEKNQFVNAIFKDSQVGPRRKYYLLTEKGKDELELFQFNYHEMVNAVNNLLDQGGKYHE